MSSTIATEIPTTSTLTRHEQHRFLDDGMKVVLVIALAKLALHCYFNNRYGYFRDEFDYMSCGDHLAWGDVDQPPLIPFLVHVTRWALGDSLRALRLVPAVANSSLVVVGALISRELGGRRFALILTAVAIVFAPIYLAYGSLVTTNCLEPLLWMGCALCVIRAIGRNQPHYWLWFGLIAGIGMEEKYSIAVFVAGILFGLLVTPQRLAFNSKWMWLGGALALLLVLPNVVWNVQHHWPFFELMRDVRVSGRDKVLSPLDYFGEQILMLQPLAGPIWIFGLAALMFWKPLRPWKSLGWSYIFAFAFFVALKGKNYYLAPIYPMLLASGAVGFEDGIGRTNKVWLKPLAIGLLVAEGMWIMPLVVPILPVNRVAEFVQLLPFKIPRPENRPAEPIIPQHYADQFGWEELVDEVNLAWQRVPQSERSDCAIFAQDYGQAGAIDFFGRRYGLPPAVSGHQTFFLWGPRAYSGKCMIVVGDGREPLEHLFQKVELVGTSHDNPYAMERQVPVYLCHFLKGGTLSQLWPHFKNWN